MSMINSMSRMRGQEKGPGYTQTETTLGESMQRFGRELGEESNFGERQQILKLSYFMYKNKAGSRYSLKDAASSEKCTSRFCRQGA